jgi:hypothetical protein
MGRTFPLLITLLLSMGGQAAVVAPPPACERLLHQARNHAGRLLARRDDGTASTSLNGPHSDKIRLDVRGVPRWLKPMPAEKVVDLRLRHYVGSEPSREVILATQELIVGSTPYVRSDHPPRWFFEKYWDLTGVFLTTRERAPDEVGVFSTSYVEVELLPGTPVFELEKDRIYMIGGPPGLVVPVRAYVETD